MSIGKRELIYFYRTTARTLATDARRCGAVRPDRGGTCGARGSRRRSTGQRKARSCQCRQASAAATAAAVPGPAHPHGLHDADHAAHEPARFANRDGAVLWAPYQVEPCEFDLFFSLIGRKRVLAHTLLLERTRGCRFVPFGDLPAQARTHATATSHNHCRSSAARGI